MLIEEDDLPRDKTILLTVAPPLNEPALAACARLVEILHERKNRLITLHCEGELASCWMNPSHGKLLCSLCRRVRRDFEQLTAVDISDRVVHAQNSTKVNPIPAGDKFIQATLVSRLRDPDIERLSGTPEFAAQRDTVRQVYLTTRTLIEESVSKGRPIDLVFVFNGRMTEFGVVAAAAAESGLPVVSYDHYGDGSLLLVAGVSVHSLGMYQSRSAAFASSADLVSLEPIPLLAEQFRNKQRRFQRASRKGRLPKNFDPREFNVSVFLSSEDEFVTLPEWGPKFGKSQKEALELILMEFDDSDSQVNVWIRFHPNSLVNWEWRREVTQVIDRFKFARHIHPLAPVDSYALVTNSRSCFTFGSTIGLEAVALGVPSVLLGAAHYEGLDLATVVTCPKEAVIAAVSPTCPDDQARQRALAVLRGEKAGVDVPFLSGSRSRGHYREKPLGLPGLIKFLFSLRRSYKRGILVGKGHAERLRSYLD